MSSEVLVVDDHELVSTALVLGLRAEGLAARRVDPSQLADATAGGPGLVLLDLDLGTDRDGTSLDGARLVPALRQAGWRVLIVTGTDDEHRIASGIAAGAAGWVAKAAPLEQLVAMARRALDGTPVIDPDERTRLCALARKAAELDSRWRCLTPRERQVLGALGEGKRAAAIADEYVVSLATVRAQIRSVLAKLEVSSQLEAVAIARRLH